MAATLTQDRFTGPDWIFERKFDGIRLLSYKNGPEVSLFSRNRLPQTIPSVVQAINKLPAKELILDGEVSRESGRLTYHVFDIMWLDGRSLTSLPLEERQALLSELPLRAPLERVSSIEAQDDSLPWERALSEGWEGVIAKRRDFPIKIGVYSFSSSVRQLLPIRPYDRAALRQALAEVPPPGGGTAIGEAMATVRPDLYRAGVFRKYLLVVTDGENTNGRSPDDVARDIWEMPVRVDNTPSPRFLNEVPLSSRICERLLSTPDCKKRIAAATASACWPCSAWVWRIVVSREHLNSTSLAESSSCNLVDEATED